MVPPAAWLRDETDERSDCGAAYLVLVTVLAAVLRLWRLDAMSLWIDEIFTWQLVDPGHGRGLAEMLRAAYQGPLYPVAVWPLLRLAETAFLLRLPAALAGIVAVPLMGIFAARLCGRMTARLAALFLAISPFAVWYAQEGRGYSFVILLSIAAGLVMLPALREGPNARRMLVLALLGFLGLTSNNSFIFLLAAFGMTVLLVARPRQFRQWLLWSAGLGGGILLASPWLLSAAGIWEIGRIVPGVQIGAPLRGETTFTAWALPFTAHTFFYGYSLGPSLTELHGTDRLEVVRESLPLLLSGGLIAATAVCAGLARLNRRQWFLTLWIVVPLALVVLLAVRNIKPFNVRYVAAAFPWVLVLAALGAARSRCWLRLCLCAGLSLFFLAALAGHFFNERFAKEDVRGAVAAIAASPWPRRPLLAPASEAVVRHYWKGESPVTGMYGEPLIRDAAMADAVVRRYLEGDDEVWIIWVRSWDVDPQNLLPAALARHGSLERFYVGPNVAVDLWRRRPQAKEQD